MRILFVTILLVLISPSVIAETDCTDRPECWPEGSAMNTGLVANQRLEKADKQLNITYQQIVKNLPEDEDDEYPKRALIAAQREWVKYRDAECTSVGEASGGVRMWKSTYTVLCKSDMTEARTKELVNQFKNSEH